MRLVTWNCYRGDIAERLKRLSSLRPDIVALQECRQPVSPPSNTLWKSEWPEQGVALIDLRGAALTRLSVPCEPATALAARIDAHHPFTCVNVWAHRAPNYEAHVHAMLDGCRNMEGELVLLGDFNSTPTVTGTRNRHEGLVSRLESEFGLVSAYHAHRNEQRGSESEATFWRGRSNPKPFHIDYCFLPAAWVPQIRCVKVGSYADWRDSDHRPLLVEIDFDSAPPPLPEQGRFSKTGED